MRLRVVRIKPLILSTSIAILVALFFSIQSESSAHEVKSPQIAGCDIFPANHVWNTPIDQLPLDKNSSAYVASIGAAGKLKADFGSGQWEGGPIGIPYMLVDGTTQKSSVAFEYADESDKGPYPIPKNPMIEGGANSNGDRHIILIDKKNCFLYELYAAYPKGNSWKAGSGAIFDLKSNKLRPNTWTSADAAGLPIFPGLVRYDEVLAGEINHAIRFTVKRTRRDYVWPARHYASKDKSTNLPPMGQRFRLKKDFDISGFSKNNQVILRALKTYGLILADNGSNWYMSGAPDNRWKNDDLRQLSRIQGKSFEAVNSTSLIVSDDSGEAKQNPHDDCCSITR